MNMTEEFEEVSVVEVLDAQGNQVKEGVAYLFSFDGEGFAASAVIVESVNGSGTVDGWSLEFKRALNDISPAQLSRPIEGTWDAWPEWKEASINYAGVEALDLT